MYYNLNLQLSLLATHYRQSFTSVIFINCLEKPSENSCMDGLS